MKDSEESLAAGSILIPTTIFVDRTLKILESVVEYLKESKSLSYHEIAALLNRNDRTIWTAYSRAKKKRQPHVHAALPEQGMPDPVFFPSSILSDRSVKVFERIVEFLRTDKSFTNHQIAVLLNRDDRTVWTIYSRVKKKRNKEKSQKMEGTP